MGERIEYWGDRSGGSDRDNGMPTAFFSSGTTCFRNTAHRSSTPSLSTTRRKKQMSSCVFRAGHVLVYEGQGKLRTPQENISICHLPPWGEVSQTERCRKAEESTPDNGPYCAPFPKSIHYRRRLVPSGVGKTPVFDVNGVSFPKQRVYVIDPGVAAATCITAVVTLTCPL